MQYELFLDKLTKLEANEVSTTFGFKPCYLCRLYRKENNQNKKIESGSRIYLTDYPDNFKNLAKIKTTKNLYAD